MVAKVGRFEEGQQQNRSTYDAPDRAEGSPDVCNYWLRFERPPLTAVPTAPSL